MSKQEEKGVWRTINGVHVFIREGETPTDALNRTIAKKNEDTKAEQIAKNKANADKLNGKTPKEKVPTKGKPVEYKGYGVDYDIYGKGEYTVSVDGDDVMFKTYDQAKAYIDKFTGDSTNNADKLKGKSSDTEEEEFDVEYWTTYNGRTAKQYARVTSGKDDMYSVRDYIKKYVKDNDLGELSHLDIGRKGSGRVKEENYTAHPMYTSQFKVKDSRPLDQIAQDYIKKYKLAKGESKIPLAVIKKDIAKLDLSEKEYTRLLGMIVLGV